MKNLYCGTPNEVCGHRDEITLRCSRKKACEHAIDADENPEAAIHLLAMQERQGAHEELAKVNKILDAKPEGAMAEEKKEKRKYTRSGKYSKKQAKAARVVSEPLPEKEGETVIVMTKAGRFVGAYDKDGTKLNTVRIEIDEIPA